MDQLDTWTLSIWGEAESKEQIQWGKQSPTEAVREAKTRLNILGGTVEAERCTEAANTHMETQGSTITKTLLTWTININWPTH